ncbi:MAG TPA: HAD-IC family P-type ATPase, partial [Acidimicrobiia bacterium]|nr:HAD-IC family P-type ATPase [Acidimicrobiia bacterium]
MTAVHMGVPLGASARVAPPDSHAVRSADEVAESFGVVPEMGLSSDDVASRRAAWGPNRLAEAPSRSPWLLFLDQFRNLLVLILIAAAILAFVVSGELKDPVVIAVVVVFNAALGFVQERRAEASLAALKQMLVATARVRRDGDLHEIDADEIVAGDIVVVEAGDRIPADGRWLRTVELEVDEASFTGESAPVAKDAAPVATRDAVLAELRSMGFMNTTVTRGRGELVVTATGMDTQIGEVAGMLAAAEQTTSPLEHQIHMLARRLTVVAGAAVAAVMLIGLARGQSLEDEIINAVALAVAAIPEGLPAVLTITLALGTRQLAKRNAIMKRLASVETLGCTSVICTDKTGTLTLNQMTTRVVWVAGVEVQVFTAAAMADLQPLLTTAILCNDSRLDGDRLIGDPTEGALLGLGQACGLKQEGFSSVWTRTAEIPFDSTRKMMVTAHQRGDRVRISAKGAVDALLPHCTQQLKADGEGTDLDDAARRTIAVAQDRFAGRGLRVLGIASRETDVSRLEDVGIEALVADLVFEGLVGIMDPPRPEAKDAIALCRRAGIAVKMLTGDHATTATAIARELGLDGDIVTGSELDAMDDESLARRIDEIGVVARVAPAHKVRIVSALRDRGRVVAMTGDGVNDAPALKAADIGIAMGVTGTEVSKEAATMVLTDDNFATIVEAVRGGRSIYDNIVKFVRFQLSTNMGAILTILGA